MNDRTARDASPDYLPPGPGCDGAPSHRREILREAVAWGRSRPAGSEAYRCEVTREAEAQRLAANGGEAFLGAVREAMRWGSWEGQIFAETQWETQRDTAIAGILRRLPAPRPPLPRGWMVLRERQVAGDVAAHAGEVGVLVKLTDNRKAWGFGTDRVAAVAAAVERAHAVNDPEDPAEDVQRIVETWSTASLEDLPLKTLEGWSDWDWSVLNAPVLQSTVPAEYAGVIKDAAGEFNEYNSLDFRQHQLEILAIDDADMALVYNSVYFNYEGFSAGTLAVLPKAEAFTKADRYRMNARILAIENEVPSAVLFPGEDEEQDAELARRCRREHDLLATERERALFTECLAARGHDLAPAADAHPH